SPRYCATMPPRDFTSLAQQVWNAAMTSRCSSASRRVESALEPTMSQNMIVNCRGDEGMLRLCRRRHHNQRAETRQSSCDFLDHATSKVLVPGIVRHVREGKDRD